MWRRGCWLECVSDTYYKIRRYMSSLYSSHLEWGGEQREGEVKWRRIREKWENSTLLGFTLAEWEPHGARAIT
jgi:hypothetical protein